MKKATIKTGIDILIKTLTKKPPPWLAKKRLGILFNPASLNKQLRSSAELINQYFPKQLKALFSPQHGVYASKQDNMVESEDFKHPQLNIPVFSLYGRTRIPTQAMMDHIDTLLVDLQDVGTRVYTYFYTLSYCMEAAKKAQKTIVILDRPNPISGSQVEGNCLETGFRSFVGQYSIPMRHGLTIAEFANFINETANIQCDLEIVPMKGWKRDMYFDDTDLTWVAPSPNMPTLNTAIVYPGQVLFEGTNISEGRGTTLPFEMIGAPFIDNETLISDLGDLPGILLRPVCFEPTFNKWKDELCKGFQIHVKDRKLYNSYISSLRILQAIIRRYPNDFQWKRPPYEYEYEKMPIDLIIGSQYVRKAIEEDEDIDAIQRQWKSLTANFKRKVAPYLLYK